MSIDPRLIAYTTEFNPTQYLIDHAAWTSPVAFPATLDTYEIADEQGETPIHNMLCDMLRPCSWLFFCQESNRTTITTWLMSAVWPDWAAHFKSWDSLPYDKYPDLKIVREIDLWLELYEERWVRYTW